MERWQGHPSLIISNFVFCQDMEKWPTPHRKCEISDFAWTWKVDWPPIISNFGFCLDMERWLTPNQKRMITFSLGDFYTKDLLPMRVTLQLVLCKVKRPLWWPHLYVWELIFGWPGVGRSTPHRMAISQIPTLTAHMWQTKCRQIYPANP